jgi:dTDP-4-dehydrorhamnose 3,5-epimerase-like enzyme
MNYHEDDRGQRLFDLFPELNGQINITYVNSTSHVVAWHRHEIQTDYWFCPKGSFKVGLGYEKDDGTVDVVWEYISDKNHRVLEIPPGVWHGYRALQPESIMLYYLTEKYNFADEEKVLPGAFYEDWNTISQ